jgi:hypothetical protein
MTLVNRGKVSKWHLLGCYRCQFGTLYKEILKAISKRELLEDLIIFNLNSFAVFLIGTHGK